MSKLRAPEMIAGTYGMLWNNAITLRVKTVLLEGARDIVARISSDTRFLLSVPCADRNGIWSTLFGFTLMLMEEECLARGAHKSWE